MKWYFVAPLVVVFSILIWLLTLKLEPIIPYVSEINANSKDLLIVKRELSNIDKNLTHGITKTGNYPITIDFIKFEGEDKELLGYSLVDEYNCDIKINLDEKWTRTKFKLVLYHEIGHCYGLDHSDSATIMEANLANRDQDELSSIPVLFNHLENSRKTIWLSNTGFEKWDNWVNDSLDNLIPPVKDKFARKNMSKYKMKNFKFIPDESKKMDYED